MGGSSAPSTTRGTTTQSIDPYLSSLQFNLFDSAFGAARQASGQQPYRRPDVPQLPQYGQSGGFNFPQQSFGSQLGEPLPGIQGKQGGQLPPGSQLPAGSPISAAQQPFQGGVDPYTHYLDTNFGPNSYQSNIPAAIGLQGTPNAAFGPIVGQPFPGSFTAPTVGTELESLGGREAVGRQLQGIGNPLLQLGAAQAGGAFLNPYTNPYFQSSLDASLQPAIDAFTRSTIPQFNSQAIQSGAFKGSSARDFAFNDLANDFGRNLAQTAAQMGNQNYFNERAIQQQTPQLLQQAAGLQQLSPEILAQVGAGQRELLQRPLDEALLQYQESVQAPFRPLFPLASIFTGGNLGGISSQIVQGPRPSPLASGIAGGLGGGALGLTLADQLGLGSLGTGAAGGLGALLGGLGGGLG